MRYVLFVTLPLLFAAGCSSGDDPAGPTPTVGQDGVVFPGSGPPPSQDEVCWGSDGTVVWYDAGIVPDTVGSYIVDPAIAGTWIREGSSGEQRKLANIGHNARLSPDAQLLAVEVGGQIQVMDRFGGIRSRLTAGGRNFFPAWSPDGTRVAYDSSTETSAYKIAISRSDGQFLNFVGSTGPGDQRMADWNPLTSSILCVRYPDAGGANQIFEISAGGALKQLTNTPDEKASPRYSPDATHIVFTAHKMGVGSYIYVMTSLGDSVQQVSPERGINPCWSPDGNSIAYTRITDPASPAYGTIWAIDLRSSAMHQLTFHHVSTSP